MHSKYIDWIGVIALILTLWLAGCTTTPEADLLLPRQGASAVYQATTGAALHVELSGYRVVRDAWGEPKLSAEVSYILHPGVEGASQLEIVEYVDVATGLHVRHEVDCLVDNYHVEFPCDENYTQVFFAAHGLPGALGLGPSWARSVAPTQAIAHSTDGFQVTPPPGLKWIQPEDRDDCWGRVPPNDDWQPFGAWLPITSVSAPLVWCRGILFPTEFIADMNFPGGFPPADQAQFRLVSWNQGSGQAWPQANDEWVVRPPPSPLGTHPTAIIQNHGKTLPFTGPEAHEQLLNKSSRYAELLSSGASITGFTYRYERAAMGTDVGATSRTDEMRARLVTPEETTWLFTVQKQFTNVSAMVLESYEVLPESLSERDPSQAVPSPAIALDDAIRISAGWVGCGTLDGAEYRGRLDEGRRDGRWEAVIEDRALARVYFRPPMTSWTWSSWTFVYDGLTGAPLEMTLTADQLEKFDSIGYQPRDCDWRKWTDGE